MHSPIARTIKSLPTVGKVVDGILFRGLLISKLKAACVSSTLITPTPIYNRNEWMNHSISFLNDDELRSQNSSPFVV